MVITYYGRSYFKLTLGDLTIALNPPAKATKPTRFGADIALISVNTTDYNDPETVTLGDKVPFVIDGPGSYESRELFFAGALSRATIDNKEYNNTVYGFELDGIKIVSLGLLADDKAMSAEAKELAGTADMIFVSVGTDPARAYKIATSFEPNMIIPTNFDKDTLAKFLKEAGQEKVENQDKATLKRKDLDGKQDVVLVLSDQS